MRGWILYKYPESALGTDAYEMQRFLKVGRAGGLDLEVVTQEQCDLLVTGDRRRSVRINGLVAPLPDFLLPRRGAGTTYFCLAIIRHLEQHGVYVVNKSASIETVKDKLYTQQILARSGLPFAKTLLVRFPVDGALVERTLGFPVVVKTVSGAQGKGVFLAENRRQFLDLMHLICAAASNTNIILQEFIRDSYGRDLRVIVIGGKAVACMRRNAPAGGFKANVSGGGTSEPWTMTPQIAELAIRASSIFDLDVAGVDLLFDGSGFKICEVNSSPGFKGLEACHPGLNIAREIFRYTQARLKERPSRRISSRQKKH